MLKGWFNSLSWWDVALSFLSFGLGLLSIGWWGESVSDEFWADHAYYLNLASAVTGAFFGIPIIVIAVRPLQRVQL